jgi:hypothetical protein
MDCPRRLGRELAVQNVGVTSIVSHLQVHDKRVDDFGGVGGNDAERRSICHC